MTTVAARLGHIWADAPGIPGWLSTVDHKRIGHRYIVTAFAYFLFGGLLALLIRAQLVGPDVGLLGPEAYNRVFTMHGTTMIFLFNTPMLAGFGNYLVPLQIGARDMAFPRLNAFSYWVYLLAGLFMYSSFLVDDVPDGGWFGYVPLTGAEYSPGLGIDFWALGIIFLGISTTVGGINFIVTILKLRAPGMSVSRLPLFTWSILVMSVVILFALPAITLGPLLLEFDRTFGMHFFDAAGGGDPLLYQHLFWFWGHPEVYILLIPATGMISMIVPTFARQPIVAYTLVAAALAATGFISFGLWVHHMFTVGLPLLTASFFSAASLLITIPSGIQIFAWLATLRSGMVRWTTPLLFAIGFLLIFVLGGFTGVMVGVVPFDWQVHDSYFVVAHFHYVLVGGVVFPIFAALYFWFPKMVGRLLHERLGKLSFWLMFVGFNVAFFPQHILGFLGMPRRVYTYHTGLGWDSYNLVSSLGGYLFALGVLVSLANFAHGWRRGRPAGPNPWGASSLEWATTSPPQDYNFLEIPRVGGREPLWEGHHAEGAVEQPEHGGPVLAPHEPEHFTVGTAGVDALPEAVLDMPGPSLAPLVLALGLLGVFTGMLVESVPLGAGGLAVATAATVAWLRRTEGDL